MIDFGDPQQEEFNVGISFNYLIFDSEKFQVELPVQFLAKHYGGEIDTNPNPAITYFNAALGFSLVFPMDNISWLKEIRTDNYYADYFTGDDPVDLPFSQGQGFFANVSGKFKWFELMISYWNGNKFIAPQGTPVYQSVAWDYSSSGYIEEDRELLFFRFMYEMDFNGGLSLAFRFEPVYDFGNSTLDHMEVLFLRYNTDFLLNKKRRKVSRRKIFLYASLLIIALFLIIKHELVYYAYVQAKGQLEIIMNARPVEELMAEEDFPDSLKSKLKIVEEVKKYAIEELGLKGEKNYTTYYDQHGRELMWVVSACEPFELGVLQMGISYPWQFFLQGIFQI